MTNSIRTAVWCALVSLVFGASPARAKGKTGPDIGERIPAFELPDQNGNTQTFESLRGPKGLVLVFVRSADW